MNEVDPEVSLVTGDETECEEEHIIVDGTDFLLVTLSGSTTLTADFSETGTVDVLHLPRKGYDEYLVVKSDGTLIWASLEGTTLTEKQTLTVGVDNLVAATVSFKCLDTCSQRYTMQLVSESGGSSPTTTAFVLWRVNDQLDIVTDSFTTGSLDLTKAEGELTLATDQSNLEMVGATVADGVANIFRFEPTKTNLYATLYTKLYLPDGSSIAHMDACNGQVDIVLDNGGGVGGIILLKNGKANLYP